MKRNACDVSLAAGALLPILFFAPHAGAQFYRQTNLVSDISGMASLTDSQLVNPWGVSFGPTTPFWVSDAGTGVSTLYAVDPMIGTVSKVGLVVNLPSGVHPSGQLFSSSAADFVVSSGGASGPSRFIFAGLNGTISGWNPGVPPPATSTQALLAATGPAPAAYTGIALATRSSGEVLYTANPAGGRIDAFDSGFNKISLPGAFTDPNLPAGDAPFNIANIGGSLYVSYTGPTGVINVFDTDGNFLERFATGGTLLNPWGMAVAPPSFGQFSHALLVGNFNMGSASNGPGNISAFDLSNRNFLGLLKGTDSHPLAIDGLWALIFGNDANGGNSSVLYFSAGIQNQQHGLFGSLAACRGPVISGASASPNVLWPPNGQLVPVMVNYSVADDCDTAPACSLSVSASQTPRGGDDQGEDLDNEGHSHHGNHGAPGLGQNAQGAVVVNAHEVELPASRDGNGGGQVFTIAINCQDQLPLSSSASVTVAVPHDQGN
jgi:uncharacterized protein (TIGR03118 family)